MRQYLTHNPLIVRISLVIALAAIALFAFYTPASAACANPADIGCAIVDVGATALASLLLVLVQVFNFVLGWAGMFFNWAMMATVFEFSSYFGNTAGLLLAWTILRDLANIALLFGFVYTGVRMMLDIDKFDVKKTIPTLIIYAALLNFSLFAGEAMIDVSNAVGSTIYAQATSLDCRTAEAAVDCADQGIAGSVLQISGLASVMEGGEGFQRIVAGPDPAAKIGLAFALLVFSIIMIGVLVAGALMLISRAITLMLLLVVSPIGFAGAVIPGLEKFSKDWWTRLTNNVLFAPVFVLLVLIGLKIAEGIKASFVGPDTSLLNALSAPNMNVGSIFVMFAIVSGFMIAALISAQRFSLVGSKQVVNTALKFIGNTAGGVVLQPVGAFSNGLGRMYNQGARVVRRNTPAPIRFAANLLGASAASNAVRGALAAPGNLKIPGTGMDSYNERKKADASRRKEMTDLDRKQASKATATGFTDIRGVARDFKENIGLGETDATRDAEARQKEAEKRKKAGETQATIRNAFAKVRNNPADTDDLEKEVNKMGVGTFKDLSQTKPGSKELETMTVLMTTKKYREILADKDVSEDVKKSMKKTRNAPANIRTNIGSGRMTVDEVARLPDEVLTNTTVLNSLKPKHFSAIAKVAEVSGRTRDELKAHVANLMTGTSPEAVVMQGYVGTLPGAALREFKDFYDLP